MRKILLMLLFIAGSGVCGYAQELQEVVYLKNGSIIKGIVIEQVPGVSLKIQTADGSIFAYNMGDVEKITKEAPSYSSHSRNKFSSHKQASDKKGYKGFFEFGGAFGVGDFGDGVVSLSTSHGYQFNPYFYLGAGLGMDYHVGWSTFFMPVFVDSRAYFLNNDISPYLGIKLGYSPIDGTGLYFSPSLGVSFTFSKSFGMNLALGYNMQFADILYSYGGYGYTYTSKENIGGLSLKIGLEF